MGSGIRWSRRRRAAFWLSRPTDRREVTRPCFIDDGWGPSLFVAAPWPFCRPPHLFPRSSSSSSLCGVGCFVHGARSTSRVGTFSANPTTTTTTTAAAAAAAKNATTTIRRWRRIAFWGASVDVVHLFYFSLSLSLLRRRSCVYIWRHDLRGTWDCGNRPSNWRGPLDSTWHPVIYGEFRTATAIPIANRLQTWGYLRWGVQRRNFRFVKRTSGIEFGRDAEWFHWEVAGVRIPRRGRREINEFIV